MKLVKVLGGLLVAVLAGGSAQAVSLDAVYQKLTGTSWQVAFTLHADGTPPAVSEFSVFFPETSFSTLTLQSSPGVWDSIIVQPDVALPSAGFLDALLPAPAPGLSAGQSQGGWLVDFNFIGAGVPGPLHFDILDSSFTVIGGGQTTAPVPEPSGSALMLAGLVAVALGLRRADNHRACRGIAGGQA